MTSLPEYELIRSKRKTLSLVINNKGKLIARAPLRMPQKEIEAFIIQKANWIATKQQQLQAAQDKYQPVVIKTGEHLPFLGRHLIIKRSEVGRVKREGTLLLIPQAATEDTVVAWMKRESKKLLTQRVHHYASIMGLSYKKVKISSAQQRWGSCSADNNLNFAWRLIMCPLDAIDYVVVHELCHIKHKNHSAQFWATVQAILPRYKVQKKWLKDNHALLELF